jgi:predicted RNase H-like HicB family nuclease
MKKYLIEVVVEKDADGYFAYCPTLQGCYTQGKSYENVMVNIRDAMRLHLLDRKASGQKLPTTQSVSVTTLELSL